MACWSPKTVKMKLLHEEAIVPEYKTKGAAGCDLHAVSNTHIRPGETVVVPTGLAVALPEGFELQIRPRSGLAARRSITVLNSPGTIDSDYRGEIKVIMHNSGTVSHFVEAGDRIAQAVLARAPQAMFMTVLELDDTDRGDGGLGSTGK